MKVHDFLSEARLMKTLRHKNLVQLLGLCTREPPYYIVTEFMPNGNLLDYLRAHTPEQLPPPALLFMATEIACGKFAVFFSFLILLVRAVVEKFSKHEAHYEHFISYYFLSFVSRK